MADTSLSLTPDSKAVQIQIQPECAESIRLYHVDLNNRTCPIDMLVVPASSASFKVCRALACGVERVHR